MELDIATTRGMLHSYLGIVAHFYDSKTMKVKNAALDLIPLSQSHTAEYIKYQYQYLIYKYNFRTIFLNFFEEIGIEPNCIVRIVTD